MKVITELEKKASALENLLAACGIDETKAMTLTPKYAKWFGLKIAELLGSSAEVSAEELAEHILRINRLDKVEVEINRLYEQAVEMQKTNPEENGTQKQATGFWSFTWTSGSF